MIFTITDTCSQRVAEAYCFFSVLRTDTLIMQPKIFGFFWESEI